jgi:hypothetical protein
MEPMEPKATTPAQIAGYLAQRWAEGHRSARHPLPELKERGYAGSQNHLERLLGQWRRADHAGFLEELVGDEKAIASSGTLPLAPIAAASLCIKPTKLLTEEQSERVAQLKRASPSFATMRQLAMRFRGILRGKEPDRLADWMNDAKSSGLYGIRRFVFTMRNDMAAVRNAISKQRSNGQAEGQIESPKDAKASHGWSRKHRAPTGSHVATISAHSLRKTLKSPMHYDVGKDRECAATNRMVLPSHPSCRATRERC